MFIFVDKLKTFCYIKWATWGWKKVSNRFKMKFIWNLN